MARIAAANLANYAEIRFKQVLNINNIIMPDHPIIFLPFRDTNQQNFNGPDRSNKIFCADIDKLNHSVAVIARLDGLVKDSGVCMEIGYAYSQSKPIGVLITDFIWEGCSRGCSEWIIDPVLQNMATVIHHAPEHNKCHGDYIHTMNMHEMSAIQTFVNEFISDGIITIQSPPHVPPNHSIYIDIMGGRYSWAREQQHYLMHQLQQAGYLVSASTRYSSDYITINLTDMAEMDIINCAQADIVVISGDSLDCDPGSSAIFGLAVGLSKYCILIHTSSTLFTGAGGQQMLVNLMIEQASNKVCNTVESVVAHIQSLTPQQYARK